MPRDSCARASVTEISQNSAVGCMLARDRLSWGGCARAPPLSGNTRPLRMQPERPAERGRFTR